MDDLGKDKMLINYVETMGFPKQTNKKEIGFMSHIINKLILKN